MLENESKNRWSLPCGELLLSLICTGDFGKGSPLHLFYIVYTFVIFLYHCSKRKKSICRKGEGACFSWNLLCILRTTATRHMGSFIDFYFHFLANSQTWTWPHTGSLNLLMLWNPCDTNSEPGLPVVLTHMCYCVLFCWHFTSYLAVSRSYHSSEFHSNKASIMANVKDANE